MRTLALDAIAAAALLVVTTAGSAAPPSSVSEPSSAQAGESLSTKLNKSDGVITPKADIDPGIHAAAPDPHPNSTPVVPPAATGGGTAK